MPDRNSSKRNQHQHSLSSNNPFRSDDDDDQSPPPVPPLPQYAQNQQFQQPDSPTVPVIRVSNHHDNDNSNTSAPQVHLSSSSSTPYQTQNSRLHQIDNPPPSITIDEYSSSEPDLPSITINAPEPAVHSQSRLSDTNDPYSPPFYENSSNQDFQQQQQETRPQRKKSYSSLKPSNHNDQNIDHKDRHISFALDEEDEIHVTTPTPTHQAPQPSANFLSIPTRTNSDDDSDSDSEENNDKKDSKLARDPSVMKRHRWGTQRHKKGRPKKGSVKRSKSIFSRSEPPHQHVNLPHHVTAKDEVASRKSEDTQTGPEDHGIHRVYFNLPLPDDMIDPENGLPSVQYPRNKIRTTKYTPLSFIPKNLFFQFKNIANIYFLFIVILGVSF